MLFGRLAQLVEHPLDVREVTGSSPVSSTKKFLGILMISRNFFALSLRYIFQAPDFSTADSSTPPLPLWSNRATMEENADSQSGAWMAFHDLPKPGAD